MNSIVLIPYCPLPCDTGGKAEMWKHLSLLRSEGPCTIVSARSKPVGSGWGAHERREIERQGYRVVLREDNFQRRSWWQLAGILYASLCKGLRLEKAFGHSNPYHRYAFNAKWWYELTSEFDLAVVNYSFWAWMPTACPKAVALLDLWSDFAWEGHGRETRDLRSANLVVVISRAEEDRLRSWGVERLIWSPPSVPETTWPDSNKIGMIGADRPFNREGIKWLSSGQITSNRSTLKVNVFGGLARHVKTYLFTARGGYEDSMAPYRECGIILMTTALGLGVQIKGIEALAAGRAIVARKCAMRGLPDPNGAWIETNSPDEMLDTARWLQTDQSERQRMFRRAREYYRAHLESSQVLNALRRAYRDAAASSRTTDSAH